MKLQDSPASSGPPGYEPSDQGPRDHGAPPLWTWRTGATVVGAGVAGVLTSSVTALVSVATATPLGLTSGVLGGAVGAAAAGTAWLYLYGNRGGLRGVAAAMGVFAAAVQHFWLYLVYVQQWRMHRALHPEVALFREDDALLGFGQRMMQEATASNLVLWSLDAAIAAGTAALVAWLIRRNWTYCVPCLGWYGTRWRGQARDPDRPASLAATLAEAPDSAQVHVLACPRRCGPALVQLKWTQGAAELTRTQWAPLAEEDSAGD